MDYDLHLQNSKSTSESVYNDPAASLLRKSNLRTLEFECICEGMEFAGLKIRNLRKIYVRMIGEACLTNVKEKSRKSVHWNRKYQEEIKDLPGNFDFPGGLTIISQTNPKSGLTIRRCILLRKEHSTIKRIEVVLKIITFFA